MPYEFVLEFSNRAAKLLTLQCGGCHSPQTLQLESPRDEAQYAQAIEDARSQFTSKKVFQAFLEKRMPSYERGEETPASFLEYIASVTPRFEAVDGNKYTLIAPVLKLIRDPERRANLHLRFIRLYPRVHTMCCSVEHCARCHKRGFHEGMTCEEYQATQTNDDIVTCPSCSIFLVKGDGCNSINCVCGTNFNWGDRIHAMERSAVDAYIAQLGGREAAALGAARVLLNRAAHSAEVTRMATGFSSFESSSYQAGQAELWTIIQPNRSSVAWSMALTASGGAQIIPVEHQPLLQAWCIQHADDIRAFATKQRQLQSAVFCDLYPHDPDMAALRIVRERRYGMAFTPDVETFALAHWDSMSFVQRREAIRRSNAARADEWARGFSSVQAAAKAAWQWQQWQQFDLVAQHSLVVQMQCFVEDARYGYNEMQSSGSLNLSLTELWAEGWSKFVARCSHEQAMQHARRLATSSTPYVVRPRSWATSPTITSDLPQRNIRAHLLDQIREIGLARAARDEVGMALPAEFLAIVEDWLKVQDTFSEQADGMTPQECWKAGVSCAC